MGWKCLAVEWSYICQPIPQRKKLKHIGKIMWNFWKKYLAICRLKPRKKKNISEIVFDISDTYLARPKPRKEGKTFLKNILKQRRR